MNEDQVRQATVRLLHALRNEFLRDGANSLKHWEQIHDRMRAAARMTTTVPEWVTHVQRGLGLAGASAAFSARTRDLSVAVGTAHQEFLDLVEREHGYLMALTRLAADEARRERQREATHD